MGTSLFLQIFGDKPNKVLNKLDSEFDPVMAPHETREGDFPKFYYS